MIIGAPCKVNAAEKILTVPLDSRPFCSTTVVAAARIASTEIILPPHELLDYFTLPGEVDRLRQWVLAHIDDADAAILSIDQLSAGGLIASREKILSDDELERLSEFLRELRRRARSKKIYAFSILPRHLPPATIENYHQRRALIEYSRLLSRADADDESLLELDRAISVENKKLYFDRFRRSERLNRRLIELTADGIIDRLLIGSDDSARHSVQNILSARLSKLIRSEGSRGGLDARVSMTHGADELALTLLAIDALDGRRLRIKVEYNDRAAAYRVMPFMSAAVGEVVVEKIGLLGASVVDSDEDFTLFVSVNDTARSSLASRRRVIDRIKKIRRAALVDLSVHFDRDETLLPIMIERDFPINGLLSYSSFNTTSNAIGCALAEAALALTSPTGEGVRENINFLNGRVLEDQFYLKETIDAVNNSLRRSGREPSYLDFGVEYDWASTLMKLVMAKKSERYAQSTSFRQPVEFVTPNGSISLRATSLRAECRYRWNRTFEIELKCRVDCEDFHADCSRPSTSL